MVSNNTFRSLINQPNSSQCIDTVPAWTGCTQLDSVDVVNIN